MADQKIEIKLLLRDELSKQLGPITAAMREVERVRADRAHAGMERLGGAVRVVHREFSSLARITFGGLIGGGVVAGIYGVAKALGDMAREGLQLRYTAEALGVGHAWFERMTDGLGALGMSSEEAASSVKNVVGALRDAQTFGRESDLFKTLEKGVRGSGVRLWNELRQVMAGPEGAEGAFKHLVRRMQTMDPTGQRELLKKLGISSLAFKDLAEVLPRLNQRVQLSRKEMLDLNVANANFSINMGNIGRMLGSAVMPGVEKVTKALSDYLKTDAGKKFAAELGAWANSIGSAIAKWIEGGGLKTATDALAKAVGELSGHFTEADKTVKGMGGWTPIIAGLAATGLVGWLVGVRTALGAIIKYPGVTLLLSALAGAAWLLNKDWSAEITDPETRKRMAPGGDLEKAPTTYYEFFKQFLQDMLKGNIDLLPQKQSGEGKPETGTERRAAMQEDERERDSLNAELKQLANSTGHLADYLAVGGPEGRADGGSGFGAGISGDVGTSIFDMLGGIRPSGTPQLSLISALGGIKLASLAGDGGGGPSGDWQKTPLPAGSFAARARMEKSGYLRSFMRDMASRGESLPPPRTDFAEWENAEAPLGYGPGGNLPRPGDIQSHIRRLPQGRTPDWDVKPYWEQKQFYQRGVSFGGGSGGGGGWDEASMSGITGTLASRNAPLTGSATVDIDIGGLGQPGRDPNTLFKPQSIDGAIQMQNTTQPPHNSLSFQ